MGHRKVYREGMRFGKLVAVSFVGEKKYLCLCDCGKQKIVMTQHLITGDTTSCGCLDSIYRDSYDEDIIKKIKESVEIKENGCWEWKKSRHKQGYGNCAYKRKVQLAHRVSWMVFKGCLNKEILVLHKCDNPPCCNPDHLFLGTDRDNVVDGFSKGRIIRKKGEEHPCAKINEENVREIRSLSSSGVSTKYISLKFNISKSNVTRISNKTAWKHVK